MVWNLRIIVWKWTTLFLFLTYGAFMVSWEIWKLTRKIWIWKWRFKKFYLLTTLEKLLSCIKWRIYHLENLHVIFFRTLCFLFCCTWMHSWICFNRAERFWDFAHFLLPLYEEKWKGKFFASFPLVWLLTFVQFSQIFAVLEFPN